MKILVLQNPLRRLGAKESRALDRILGAHEVVRKDAPRHRASNGNGHAYDLVLAIGGDGTVLAAAHHTRNRTIPIVGLNTGHVGFLAGLTLQNFRKELPAILQGRSLIEDRTSLTVALPNGEAGWALNDIGFQATGRDLFAAELLFAGKKVCDYKGDGLIVATATGSTAYNLSLGGPLLAPDSAMIAITPKAPLTLTNRALVLHDPGEVTLRITGGETRVEHDSIPVATVKAGDLIRIRQAEKKVPLVFPVGFNHFAAVGEKLRWNENLITR